MSDVQADIVLCPGGPMLVRGAAVVQTEDGERHATTRPVSAVCRCGATARAPWCDGTHKLLTDRSPRSRPEAPAS